MKKIAPYQAHEDNRGRLVGLMNEGTWEEFNYLETKAGQTRGNHYHKHTVEVFFILDGAIDIEIELPDGSISREQVAAGDIVLIEPGEIHTFYCLTATRWINALSKRFEPGNPDLHVALKTEYRTPIKR
jgi:mannose-6-phosphate isomerase-like protein (cupin superfamily)